MVLAAGVLVAVLGSAERAMAATEEVEIEDFRYEPTRVRIAPGDRVEWTNEGDEAHTVTSDDPDDEDFDSGELGNGDQETHTFDEAGVYRYHCEIHDSMTGVVEVVDPDTTTTSSSTTTTTASTTTTSTTTTTTTTVVLAPTTTTPPPTSAPSPPPEETTTSAPSTTTSSSVSSTTTTTEVASTTTVPSPAPEAAEPLGPDVPTAPPSTDGGEETVEQKAAARSDGSDSGGVDATVVLLVAILLGAGAFGCWTLWQLRPLRN